MEGSKRSVLKTVKRAEIDTTAPFKTVKEAVALFGERVLASQVYANHLKVKEMEGERLEDSVKLETELEETKHTLIRAKEESSQIRKSLSCLKEELERTKQELLKLKVVPEDEESGIDEKVFKTKFEVMIPESDETRYVKNVDEESERNGSVMEMLLERQASMKKKEIKKTKKKKKNKTKSFIPLIFDGIFSKRKDLR